jgi:hypothetical protein
MKQGSNTRRPRGRNNNNKRSPGRNSNQDNGGSDVRLRGNASQVYEKYLALARDALSADDSISSENYSQHAEHFYRIMTISAENQKNTNNSSQNKDNAADQNKEKTNGQKEGSKGRDNRHNNRRISQNVDPVLGNSENKREQDKKVEEQAIDKNKIIKKVAIKTPSENLIEDASDKKEIPQESGLA